MIFRILRSVFLRHRPDRLVQSLVLGGLFLPLSGLALTLNGNDFALYYAEAATDAERSDLFEEAKGNPHFFRYLQIMELEEVTREGRTVVDIIAFEPASLMDVAFTINRSTSLQLLRRDPASKQGDALAVLGKVVSASSKKNTIHLDSVIIRYKDILSPAVGKELLCEVNPNATFYSYTGGPREVNLTYKDRDLLRHQAAVLEKGGPSAWVKFLEKELRRRSAAAAGSPGTETSRP